MSEETHSQSVMEDGRTFIANKSGLYIVLKKKMKLSKMNKKRKFPPEQMKPSKRNERWKFPLEKMNKRGEKEKERKGKIHQT